RAGGRWVGRCWVLVMTLRMGTPFDGPGATEGSYRAVTSWLGILYGDARCGGKETEGGPEGQGNSPIRVVQGASAP
ncbi:hypothetical protein B7767_40565, partial [Streptomyces sp. 13-12-16]